MLFLFCVVFLFKSFADEFHELLFAVRKRVAVFEPENIRYARLKLAQNERVVELFYVPIARACMSIFMSYRSSAETPDEFP